MDAVGLRATNTGVSKRSGSVDAAAQRRTASKTCGHRIDRPSRYRQRPVLLLVSGAGGGGAGKQARGGRRRAGRSVCVCAAAARARARIYIVIRDPVYRRTAWSRGTRRRCSCVWTRAILRPR